MQRIGGLQVNVPEGQRISPPPRGTRPHNRRALILVAAADLFYYHGYDHVSMSHIAAAVAVTPSALYRHFCGKQDLLREVVADGLAPIREQVVGLDFRDRPAALLQLATAALDHREIGVLWQREARHMTRPDRQVLRQELRHIGQLTAERVHRARPELTPAATDLLAWSVLSVLNSPSFRDWHVARPQFDHLLTRLIEVVLDCPLATSVLTAEPPHPPGPPLHPRSRREALLAQGVRMFARNGYTGVAIEDIAAAVGIVGPSVYNHFASKRDILITAFRRGRAVLFMDMMMIFGTSESPREVLDRLVGSYIRFTVQHPEIVDLMISEVDHLPEQEQHDAWRAQRDYVGEWVHLLRKVSSGLSQTSARLRVQAVFTLANDVSRIVHLRHNPGMPGALTELCTRLLFYPAAAERF